MERAVLTRASHYHWHSSVAASVASSFNITRSIPRIRDIICEAVQKELMKLLPATAQAATLSITETVREEAQRSVQPEVPVNARKPVEPTLSYVAMARRSPQIDRKATAPLRGDTPKPQYP